MFSNLIEEKNTNNLSISINNNSNIVNLKQSTLVKLNTDETSETIKNLNVNEIEDDINKIEEKLNKLKNNELFTRENHFSGDVDIIIKVPKKKIRDEVYILQDDKIQNQIKKQKMVLEEEEGKQKRRNEMDISLKRLESYNETIKNDRNKRRKHNLLLFIMILLLIILITGFIICLIIFIDKYVF